MNIDKIIELLNEIPASRSNFEFENFIIESHVTPARQLVAVMSEIEQKYAEVLTLNYKLTKNVDPGDKLLITRQIVNITHELTQLLNWYNSISSHNQADILSQYEEQESEYWTNKLGKQAALEVLAQNCTSTTTMDSMSNLPVDDFKEAVRVCTRYTAIIRDSSESAEHGMIKYVNGLPNVAYI